MLLLLPETDLQRAPKLPFILSPSLHVFHFFLKKNIINSSFFFAAAWKRLSASGFTKVTPLGKKTIPSGRGALVKKWCLRNLPSTLENGSLVPETCTTGAKNTRGENSQESLLRAKACKVELGRTNGWWFLLA